MLVTGIDAANAAETAALIRSEGGRTLSHVLDVTDAEACDALAIVAETRSVDAGA